jgi:hypothetical protein
MSTKKAYSFNFTNKDFTDMQNSINTIYSKMDNDNISVKQKNDLFKSAYDIGKSSKYKVSFNHHLNLLSQLDTMDKDLLNDMLIRINAILK